MASPIIQPSFAAGEVAPELWGRIDLAKYRSGAAVMRNFYADYRGGATSRPGTQFQGLCRPEITTPPRLIPFQFNTQQAYHLVLHGSRMRIIQGNGGYILEASQTITAGSVLSGRVTFSIPGAGGFVVGDYIAIGGVTGLVRPNGVSGVNGRVLVVTAVAGDNVTMADPLGYAMPSGWTAYIGGGGAGRVYEIDTPWAGADLFQLNYTQSADVMTVVHPSYQPHDITRTGNTAWTITPVQFGSQLVPPTGLIVDPNGSSSGPEYNYTYCVTSYNIDTKEESVASVEVTATSEILDPNEAVTISVSWNAAVGANAYRLYKAQPVPDGVAASPPRTWGLIATTSALDYQDLNYAPDFTQAPPTATDPFGSGSVASVQIDDPGVGFLNPAIIFSDPTGHGASGGVATISPGISGTDAGSIAFVSMVARGTNYTAPTAAIVETNNTPGTGLVLAFSGAWVLSDSAIGYVPAPGSITVTTAGLNYHRVQIASTIGDPTGFPLDLAITVNQGRVVSAVVADTTLGVSNSGPGDTLTFSYGDAPPLPATVSVSLGGVSNPSCVSYFQQRRAFAATLGAPDAFWLSRPGRYTNFDTTFPAQANDSISGSIVGEEVNAITSLTQMSSGLIALTSNGAYQISGGTQGQGVTPFNIQAPSQSFSGAAPLPPLRIDSDLVYMQARGSAVRNLSYNFYVNNYSGNDVSVISSHLLVNHTIIQWSWAQEPYKLVWAVRDDGVLLTMTYVKDQDVYGWTRHDTQGRFVSVSTIPEFGEDRPTVAVQRFKPDGTPFYAVERIASRNFGGDRARNIPSNPELAWCVDAGRTFPLTMPGAGLRMLGTLSRFGELSNVQIIEGGQNYPDNPLVQIVDATGQGSGAVITAVATGGVLTLVEIVEAGSGYQKPIITIQGGSAGVLAVEVRNVDVFRASLGLFSGDNTGQVLRVGGGKGVVLQAISATDLEVQMFVPVANLIPNIPARTMFPAASGEWSLTAQVMSVGGLDHLDGMMVAILADGSVQDPRPVVDGCITLDQPATAITVGLSFSAQHKTLRPEINGGDTIQGRRKTIPALTVRVVDTRGLAAGSSFATLKEIKDRGLQGYGDYAPFQTEGGLAPEPFENAPASYMPVSYTDHRITLDSVYNDDGVVCLQQSYPLPASILAVIPDILVGDDPS